MLFFIILVPFISAVMMLSLRQLDGKRAYTLARGMAFAVFFLTLGLAYAYDYSDSAESMQFVASLSWVPSLNINFQVGVDGISLWMVVLTALLSLIAICFTSDTVRDVKNYLALMLALESGILGVFVALDTILFYVFWELMLVPTYFLIGMWGEGDRVFATLKFVLYTLAGSLLMLVGIVWLSMAHYGATQQLTFDITTLVHTRLSRDDQFWMFLFFFTAFAIKLPVFPLHSWLPHAYRASPIPVLVMLTGAMSKTGAYGLLRFCLPLFPDALDRFGPMIGLAAAAGIVYGAWIAIAQKDIKSLVAYSSISHLGFIALGILARNSQGVEGSVLQMVNHGIIASALFLIVGIIEQRLGTRDLARVRGLKGSMPVLYGVFMLIALAALGLPGLNGFVGEFLILLGVWNSTSLGGLPELLVLMGGLAIVFASIYMLYMFQGSMQEQMEKSTQAPADLSRNEFGVLLPACVLAVLIGLFPQHLVEKVKSSAHHALAVEKTVGGETEKSGGHH